MRIAIIETGAPPEKLAARFGAYPAMMETMLAPLLQRASFFTVKASSGEALPPASDHDGALITGSSAGVYEDHAFIAPVEAFIRTSAEAQRPLVGICFGHQIMAQAFGGRVVKSDKGWGVGLHDYDVVGAADWMTPQMARITCPASHQDQVVLPPRGARRLLASAFCENAGLAYAQGPAISFQAHPEFEHEYAAALIALRRERLPADLASSALSSLRGRSDRGLLARWIANFLSSARG